MGTEASVPSSNTSYRVIEREASVPILYHCPK